MEQKEWFKDWFSSEYYKILYRNRDEKEAELFISNLIKKIKLPQGSKVWDNACGKGRHSYIFSKNGLNVVGTDINEKNINEAKEKYPFDNVQFFIHDMRKEFYVNYFDLAVNLFTSIGYFEHLYEEKKVIKVMANSIKKNGYLVIDFFNPVYVTQYIVPLEIKTINNIQFIIKREIKNNIVIKTIEIKEGDLIKKYTERVRILNNTFFENEFRLNKINLLQVFGDYELNPYNDKSPRMIFLGKKI